MPDRVIRRLNGPRGSLLLCLGLLCAAHVASCLPPGTAGVVLPVGLDSLEEAVPLGVYAVLWGVATVLCWAGAWRTRHARHTRVWADVAAFSAVVGMSACWGVTYMLGWWLDDDPSRQWVIALLYLALAGAVAAAGRMMNPSPDGGGHR